jgi:predicted porin
MPKPTPRRGSFIAIHALIATAIIAAPAQAIEIAAGDWKFTASGNVNVHYIGSSCESETTLPVTGGLACRGSAGEDRTSSVSNGLLPAALAIGAGTTQRGIDIDVTFGFYPGISTNDGSPNLQQGAELKNTALGTTAIDMRQVFMTFGNDQMGKFLLGRNIGLFGSDAILNDMTLQGVGAGNGNYATPANTSLGSIGLGYIYADWFGQIDYTTPSFAGIKLTVGIFDPLEPIGQLPPGAVAPPERSPGYQAKLAFKMDHLYLSASMMTQKNTGLTPGTDFRGHGWDVGGKVDFAGLEVLGWYYQAKGLGTTALFLMATDAFGNRRDSDGFLAQITYKFADLKLGANYGRSNLDLASGEITSSLVRTNKKYTVGAYYSLTENLTLLAEYTNTKAEAHNGIDNDSRNYNVGAFLSF